MPASTVRPRSAASRWRRSLPAVGYAVATAVPVTALALLAREKVPAVLTVDEAAIRSATDFTREHPAFGQVLVVWQELYQPRYVYLVGTGVCVWLWWRHGLKSRAIWGFVTMMVAWNLALDLKYVVQRARPVVVVPVSHAPGYSFPSGHAANTAAASAVVTILVWPLLTTAAAQTATCVAAAAVTALTATDRVLLGVHYPSDVVAGAIIGCGIALASYAGFRHWRPPPPPEG